MFIVLNSSILAAECRASRRLRPAHGWTITRGPGLHVRQGMWN